MKAIEEGLWWTIGWCWDWSCSDGGETVERLPALQGAGRAAVAASGRIAARPMSRCRESAGAGSRRHLRVRCRWWREAHRTVAARGRLRLLLDLMPSPLTVMLAHTRQPGEERLSASPVRKPAWRGSSRRQSSSRCATSAPRHAGTTATASSALALPLQRLSIRCQLRSQCDPRRPILAHDATPGTKLACVLEEDVTCLLGAHDGKS